MRAVLILAAAVLMAALAMVAAASGSRGPLPGPMRPPAAVRAVEAASDAVDAVPRTAEREPAPATRPLPSLQERVAAASSVAEVIALLDERDRHPDWRQDLSRNVDWFAGVLRNAEQALEDHLAEADPNDPLTAVETMSLRLEVQRAQSRLDALRNGHFYVGRLPPGPTGPWLLREWRGLVEVHHVDEDRPLAALQQDLERAERVVTFNGLDEADRRRLLSERADALANDDHKALTRLQRELPRDCIVDERTGTIR